MAQQIDIVANLLMKVDGAEAGINKLKSSLSKLKMPDGLENSFKKSFANLDVIFARYKSQVEKGFSTKADITNFAKTGKALDAELDRISKYFTELTGKQVDFKVNSTEIKNTEQELEKLINQRNELAKSSVKFEITGAKEGFKDIQSLLEKLKEVAGNTKTGQYASGALDFLKAGDLQSAVSLLDKASVSCKKFSDEKQKAFTGDTGLSMATAIEKIVGELTGVEGKFGTVNTEVAKFEQILSDLRTGQIKDAGDLAQRLADDMLNAGTAAKQANGAMQDFAQSSFNMTQQLNQLQQSTQYFFGLRNMLNLLKRGLKEAVQTVKDLDKAMTETAVVTKFSVGDMWAKLPEYTNNANALGATIQDMYESTTLYYQQGLNTEQAMSIATETMKMARIAGLEAAEATDMMTAALRGFNMEINETSAEHINDVYSNLAAKTASNTEELGTAMQRTASIAASAGMSFEGTAAFLAQAIETTREPAENLGTAMKTIVARFTELKKNPLEITEVDGEEVDYNKVDTALQSIGVSLKDANGQFRDLDKVFLDISQRWDGLTQTQQRYVATMAAGSRQQSRFIAMMSNYDRTVQLMEYANNSAGASQEQFGKTLDSLEAKLNKFQNAWKEFLMGIMNDSWTKGIVDAGTTVLSVVNKLIDALSFGGKAKGIKSVLSLFTAFTTLKFAGRGVNALIGGVGGLLDPKSSVKQGLMGGFTGRQQATNMAQAKAISTPIVSKLGEILGAIHNIKADTGANKNIKTDSNAVIATTKQQYAQARQALNDLVGQNATAKSFSIGAASSIFKDLDAEHQLSLFNNSPGTKAAMQKASLNWFGTKGLSTELTKAGKQYINSIYNGMKQGTIPVDKGIELIGRPDLWGEHFGTQTAENISKAIVEHYGNDSQVRQAAEKGAWRQLGLKKASEAYKQNYLANTKNKEAFDKIVNENITKALPGIIQSDSNKATAKISTMGKFANDIGMVGDKFTQAGYGISAFGSLLSQLGGPIGVIGTGLQSLGGIVSSLGMSISGMTSLFTLFTVGITDATGAVVVAGSTIAGIVAPIAALGVAIFAAYKHIQKIKKAGEEVTNTFKEQSKSTDDNIAILKSYQGELATLSKGVDSHGNNINLDDSEYQRYLEIVDSIAEINPEIVDGYNAQGHAIINNNKALAETLKTQQELRDEVYKTYTDSLDKLIAARNVNTDYGKAIINNYSSKAEDAGKIKSKNTPFTNDVLSIVDNLSLSTQFDENILKKYNIDSLQALKNGEEDAVNNFVKHREQIEAELRNSGIKISQSVFDGFDQLSENVTAFDAAIQPVYDNLLTQVSQSPFYDSVADEFKDALNIGLKDLASQDLSATDMSKAANSMVAKFANLTSGSGKYADVLKIVETAQNDFATTLNETQYTADVQPAINELTRLKEEALEEGTAYGDALAEYLDNQIERISRFTEEGAINLSEALNTATDEIAAAESALENFNKATETDYSTAAEGMKSIFEKTTETFKDSYGEEIQKHAEGMGDATFWSGAEALLSTDTIDQITASTSDGYEAAEQVSQAIADLEPMLRDGQEGFDAFTDRVLEHSEALDELAQYGVEYNKETGLLTNIPDDQWHNVAEALGISDDLLTSMLNKGRQFADISFMNIDEARKALATSEYTIKGTQAAAGEQQNLYVKEDTLRRELADAGYVRREQQDEQIAKLLNEGVKTIPADATQLSKDELDSMANDWGISTLPDLIQTLNETGDFTKDEIKNYADQMGLLGSDAQYDDLYSSIIEAAENPELVKQTGVLEDISAKISALMDGRTEDEALDDYNESHKALVGGEGVDTEAQAFAYGKKLNEDGTLGGFLSAGEYEQTKKSLEEVKQSYTESAAIAAEKAKISTGKEKERWEEVQKGYEEDAARVDKYLGMASNAYEKHLKDMADAAEAKKVAPGIKRAEDKDGGSNKGTTTKNEVETTETKTTKEITEKEEHTQVVADAITTGAFEVVNQELDEIDANPNHNTNITTTGDSQGVDEVRAGVASAIAEAKDPLKILTVGDTTGIATVSNGLSTLPSSKNISITATDNTGSIISRIGSKLANLASKALSIGGGGAAGINNHISVSRIPTFASAAKGKGQVGPKNKGGLTLTGEKGFEIAWLPSSGESMVLGVGGPQMVNLPSDAVVYTHEQSKDIIKRKGIPAGSHADETASVYKKKYNNGNTAAAITSTTTTKKIKDTADDVSDAADEAKDAADAVQRVSVWWENIARRTEQTQRKMDKNQKAYEKYLKNLQATLKKTGTAGQGNKYIANLNKYIKLNSQQLKKANKELRGLDKGYKDPYDQNARKNIYEEGVNGQAHENIVEISFQGVDDEGNATTKKALVDLSGYIKQLKDGSYVVDEKALYKITNKSQRKATADAANKELNDRLSKRNKAEDNIEKAREQLEAFTNELYETFFAWETSLTKIWNITQKIDEATRKISRTDAATNLLEAQISSGMKKSDSTTAKQDLQLFQQRLYEQNKVIENRKKAIKQAQQDVFDAYGKGDEIEQRKSINQRLSKSKQAKKNIKKLQNDNKDLQKKQDKYNKILNDPNASKKDKKKAKAQLKKINAQIAANKKQIKAEKKSVLSDTQTTGLKAARDKLTEKLDVIDKARQFTKVTRNADGTISINFDADKLEREKLKGNISADMAKAIEDYVNGIVDATTNLDELQESLINDVTEYYNTLTELKDQWTDYEDQLIQITEESNKKELDNLKKLSDSIKQAIDDLLNDVKRKLEERRRLEDNRKTEQDISRKQQRLAALRADTSGGHQVEIAQLEKEIGEAQQNYQRSLEDQLLDKLQQQADEAQKQRERQIQLQEALVTGVNNIAQVDAWMAKIADPKTSEKEVNAIKAEMLQAYRDANGYENKGIYGQEKIDRDFETFFEGLRTNQDKQAELTDAIKELNETIKFINDQQFKADLNIKNAKEKGLNVKQAHTEIPGASYEKLRKEGKYKAADFKKAGVGAATALKAGFTEQQLKKGGYTAADFKKAKLSYDTAKKAGFSGADLAGAYGAATAMKHGVSGASAQKGTGKSAAALQKIVNASDKDNATQKDMARVKVNNLDINGKEKGGKVTGRLSDKGTSVGYNKGSTFYWQDWDEKTRKLTGKVKSWTIDKLPASYVGGQVEARDALNYAITHQTVGSIINANMEKMVNASANAKARFIGKEFKLANGAIGNMSSKGNILYDSKGTVYVWNPSTGANKVYKKYNKKTYIAEAKKKNNTSAAYARALKYRGIKKYATGGLATMTGPAWLDGTPSKPELVLNATDTKNFLALKDVLAGAMKGMNETSNTYGDILYEININVDKIEKDYDVDRVVEKVKKEITKGAGYRNVTQVRNLR